MSFDKIFTEASSFMLKHHVSLGSSAASDGGKLSPPSGSGTLVKFQVDGKTAYGILTAAHVLRWAPIIQKRGENRQWLGLMKPSQGDGVACLCTFRFQYFSAATVHFHEQDGTAYRPDVAFVLLDIDERPQNELFGQSEFYDMDNDSSLSVTEDTKIFSGFFRGACTDAEIKDGVLNTPICLGGGEKIRFDERSAVQYWGIPNKSRQTIKGASGVGFWRFRCDADGLLTKSLAGVVIAERIDCSQIEAMAASYLFDDFLPALKLQVRHELSLSKADVC